MIDLKSPLKSATDRDAWAARGSTFVAKVQATRLVWFPPEPVKSGTKAATRAANATKKTAGGATKKTTGKATAAAKKSSSSTKKATGAAKKATSGRARKS